MSLRWRFVRLWLYLFEAARRRSHAGQWYVDPLWFVIPMPPLRGCLYKGVPAFSLDLEDAGVVLTLPAAAAFDVGAVAVSGGGGPGQARIHAVAAEASLAGALVSDVAAVTRDVDVPDLVALLIVEPVDAERLRVSRLEALQQ